MLYLNPAKSKQILTVSTLFYPCNALKCVLSPKLAKLGRLSAHAHKPFARVQTHLSQGGMQGVGHWKVDEF